MDIDDVIYKCLAIAFKEEEDIVVLMGRTKIGGEKNTENCPAGKVFLARGINKEGLKAAVQQA